MSLALELFDKALAAHVAAENERVGAALRIDITKLAAEITALKATVAARNATIATLEAENAALRAENERLRNAPTPTDPTPPVDEGPETPRAPTGDIFYRRDRLMTLPTSGASFERLAKRAKGSWQAPVFMGESASNNAQGDADALAGALYAERVDDEAMREKVRAQLRAASKLTSNWLLGLGRQLAGYVEAANLIRFAEPGFVAWVHRMVTLEHGSGQRWGNYKTILATATSLNSNWATQCNRSVLVASMYLKQVGTDAQKADAEKWLKLSVLAHKRDIGIRGDYPELPPLYTAPNGWGGNAPYKAGINPVGTTGVIGGKERVLDAVRQGDWLRTEIDGKEDRDATQWPPNVTSYMWEGLQGETVSAAILHQHGLCPFDAADNAIVRALHANYGTGAMAANEPRFVNPAEGDDKGIPWIVNHFGGSNFPTEIDDEPDKAGYQAMAWYLGETS
jgi:hypothetical protein